MMKANEFRIGNLVINNDIIYKVVSIDEEGIMADPVSQKHTIDVNIRGLVKPIPLTEEWLFRFGFVSDNYEFQETYYIDISTNERYDYQTFIQAIDMGGYVNIYIKELEREHEKYFSNAFIKRVTHIHTLQNLYFALTGEDLILEK